MFQKGCLEGAWNLGLRKKFGKWHTTIINKRKKTKQARSLERPAAELAATRRFGLKEAETRSEVVQNLLSQKKKTG